MESHDSEKVSSQFSSSSSDDSTPIKKKKYIQSYFSSDVTEVKTSVNKNNENLIVKSNAETETICGSDLKKISATSAIIWNFFTRTGKDNATCNICNVNRSTPTGTTTTLKNHLKKHLRAYQEYLRLTTLKENKIRENRKKTDKIQLSGENSKEFKSIFKNTILEPTNKRAKEITKAIALFICKGLQPYNVVEEEAFKYLLHVLEPRYKVPCRTTFSRSIIPSLYETSRNDILKDFHNAIPHIESISITTDLWTSRAKDTYIAFTLQYIDENFNMKHFTVDCKPFPGTHNAIAICQKIHEVLEDLNLNNGNISIYIVSDNGANMVRALSKPELELFKLQKSTDSNNEFLSIAKEKSWYHIRCYNHTLQLAISDTRKEVGASSVIEKVSSMVGRYNRSKPARESLQFFQSEHKLAKHELLQMVDTRWDSEFIMLERFIEQKAAIISEQSKAGLDSLTVQEWKLIEGYVEILRPIATFTADMGSKTKPTLSMVLPVLFEIVSSLEEYIKKAPKGTGIMFARKLLANIKLRFPDNNYKESELYQLAMLLDPRFKDVLCSNKINAAHLLEAKALDKQHIIDDLENIPTNEINISSNSELLHNNDKWSHFKKKTQSKVIVQQDGNELIKKQVSV